MKLHRLAQFNIASLVLFGCLTGCGKSTKDRAAAEPASQSASQAAASLSKADQAALLENVRASLKDPSSAQFEKVRLSSNGAAVCGKVNAKNGFGGYVGFRDFVASHEGVAIKPPECGTVSISELFNRSPEAASACVNYAKLTGGTICD